MTDAWATDTADPARIFREMFPRPTPIGWRLFCDLQDLAARELIRKKGARNAAQDRVKPANNQ